MPTWTHEQSTGAATAGPLAYGSNVKAGSLLVAMQENDKATPSTTPTDTRGNSWSQIHFLNASQTITWWWAISNGAGADTVTFDISSGFNAVKVSEWSVDAGTISLDVADTINRSAISPGTDVFTSPSVSASTNDSLVLGLLASENGDATTYSAGTNFTERNQTSISGSAADKFVYESRVLATAGSVQALFTSSGATTVALISVAVFKAVAAGPISVAWIRA